MLFISNYVILEKGWQIIGMVQNRSLQRCRIWTVFENAPRSASMVAMMNNCISKVLLFISLYDNFTIKLYFLQLSSAIFNSFSLYISLWYICNYTRIMWLHFPIWVPQEEDALWKLYCTCIFTTQSRSHYGIVRFCLLVELHVSLIHLWLHKDYGTAFSDHSCRAV
jgi:hypothetical protein